MEALFIIFLLVLALLLIIAELFVIGGVLGAFGFLLLLGASALTFYFYGMTLGWIVLIASIGLAIAVLVIGFQMVQNSRLGKQLILSDSTSRLEGFNSEDKTLDVYRGKTGVTLSELRPSGLVEIDGERLTVSTEGEFIDDGEPVEVIGIRYNQIIVTRKTS